MKSKASSSVLLILLTAIASSNWTGWLSHKVILSSDDDNPAGRHLAFSPDYPHELQQQQQQQQQQPQQQSTLSLGQQIVQTSFSQSFQDLTVLCPNPNESPPKFLKCIQNAFDTIRNSNHTTQYPWWFQTMLRDAADPWNGMGASWHFLHFPDPNMKLCIYGKGATKQWRKVHCDAWMGQANSDASYEECQEQQLKMTGKNATRQQQQRAIPKAVFLRDPLERFLSAFLDKCTGEHRWNEHHCEPSTLFQKRHGKEMIGEFWDDPQSLFDIYVDTVPLGWNMHMLPLSLHCGGLYKTIQSYDFVGKMDEDYYHHLHRFTQWHPTIEPYMDHVFHLKEHSEQEKNVGTEQQASLQTLKYYNARTVRRVLEYFAMDYVMLDLKIPAWAEEMLQKEYSTSSVVTGR
eukprot:Nitzschia sp. Nitz4//scaffold26_size159584//18803//20119//NITZ4_002469-RA/size159584-snap-gene-0.4-mRNA-1//1//CDS//3329545016//2288//frame0